MKTVIDGITINYEYLNRNETTVVFLHGWGGNILNFKGVFNSFIKNTKFSLLNLDFPPFGESSEPPSNFTIYDYYSLVIKLLEKLHISKVHLVAHSFGGRVAVLISALKSEIVNSLSLVSAAGLKPRKSLKTRFKIIKYKLIKTLLKNKSNFQNVGSKDYQKLSIPMKQVFVNIVNEDLTKYLQYIKCPTLIFWAKNDSQTPLYMAKKFNKKIINSGLVLYEDGGHFCYLKYHNQFVKTLLYFLK